MPDTITATELPEASEAQASTWTAAEALELNRSAAALRVPASVVDDCFTRGLTVDAARRAIVNAAAERADQFETRSHIQVGASYDDPASVRERMIQALLHRAAPGAYELPAHSREFRGLSLADMRGRLLAARGVRTRGWTADELLTRADVGGLHSTSDFPLLLADALHKELDRQIQAAETPLKALSRERTATDFRTLYINRIGNASGLEKVNEAAEFKRATWAEERESFALGTYGRIWGITRQVLVNDDLSFFSDIAEEAALAVAELEASRFVALLVGAGGLGAVVADGKTAFHADHANVGTAGAPSVESLSEARQKLRAQKGAGGLHLLGATPRTLVVPSALETTAEQLVAGITAAVVEEANPFAGKLSVAVEPRLTSATRWYVAAEAPFFAHAYLEGNRSAQVTTREGFDVDGVEFRVRHDFGACIRDWRLAVTNAGAGG